MRNLTKTIIVKIIDDNAEYKMENVVVSKYNVMRYEPPTGKMPMGEVSVKGNPIILITSNLPDFLSDKINGMIQQYCEA